MLALVGLGVFAAIGAYQYYPEPETAFDEMHRVRAEACGAVINEARDDANRQLRCWDDRTRKVQVGVILRRSSLDENVRELTEELREWLDDVRDALKDGKDGEARTLMRDVQKAYDRCRKAYLAP
jgi:hypothetical protein